MLAIAGYPLGLRFAVLDPAEDACAFQLAEALHGEYDDRTLVERLAGRADVVTYEFENVSADSSGYLAQHVPMYPSPEALTLKQDRWAEKQLFEQLEIPTAPTRAVETHTELDAAADALGFPLILKTRSYGYDGKGQARAETREELATVLDEFEGVPLIAEKCIAFKREVSIVAVRGLNGEVAFYDIAENVHHEGILRSTRNRSEDPVADTAHDYVQRLMDRLDYVGVLALELFDVDGQLLANEFAPRVHNSGHWTIEGAETSQFENHLRAILGMPLGATASVGPTAMLNCIGQLPDTAAVLALPGAHYHRYDKEPRPRRKVGHITLRAETPDKLEASVAAVEKLLD
jgi:5-(carboxyamino)imidazole ribonucleotide synthase